MMIRPKNLTKKSGVYLFKNIAQEIIYIGKAKSIAQRIATYFNNPADIKTELLLQEAISIDTIPTGSETEALLLESKLIKLYQPKYNILLKDGTPYLYIFFSTEKNPSMQLVKNKDKKGVYIGPFLSKKSVRSVYNFLQSTFQLKKCKTTISHGCLEFHIGSCAGNCTSNFDQEFYRFRLLIAQQTLQENPKKTLALLNEKIKETSGALLFEQAQRLTSYKQNLEIIFKTIKNLSNMPSKQRKESVDQNLSLLMKIKNKLKLKHVPYVIDCFDISHMQGLSIVGACVRYVHGVPEKKSFRHFMITSLQDQNDYAALQEIVQRRYRNPLDMPNLIIVDGGKGQISAIRPFIKDTELVGLAKSEETVISSDFEHFVKLDPLNAEDALILQIRDYTHHFAISFHRKKRSEAYFPH